MPNRTMATLPNVRRSTGGGRRALVVVTVLLVVTFGAHRIAATTYISAEPIPSSDVIGASDLALMLGIGYANLETWSTRLMQDCHIVEDVIGALASNGAVQTINPANTSYRVAAGGFQGVTDPSFVFTIDDTGENAVSQADVNRLDNALGYVLSQSGTTHFSPDNAKAYDFPLDYAVVTFADSLTGLAAKAFFEDLGTVDPALWSGLFAGFTQIDFDDALTNNSMLFLKPAATKRRLIDGLATAVSTTADATYVTLNNNGRPTTARGGVAFPGNDWITFPGGDQYLANLPSSASLLTALNALQQRHLAIAEDLIEAIESGQVTAYLGSPLDCH